MTASTFHDIPGWTVREDHHSAFSRSYILTPDEPVPYEFATLEVKRGRTIEATYDARIIVLRIHHSWDEKKGYWWSSANFHAELINPQTKERYKSGWRSQMQIGESYRHTEEFASMEWISDLIEQTKPRTRITVIEEAVA